jgi:hypothetical protein
MTNPSVTFTFDSEEDKSDFLGQLSDGFGENYVTMTYNGVSMDDAAEIHIELIEEDWLYEDDDAEDTTLLS